MIKTATDFGLLIRSRRHERALTQDELAARCGVARRFIIDLEAGKATCQLGKALLVAVELGIRLVDQEVSGSSDRPDTPIDDDPLSHLPKF